MSKGLLMSVAWLALMSARPAPEMLRPRRLPA